MIIPISLLKKTNKKIMGYKKIKGEVIDFREKFNYRKYIKLYYPVVRYIVDNKEYRIVGKLGYSLSPFMPKKLIVMYNPQNPNDAELSSLKKFVLIVIVVFVMGILLMLYFLINDLVLDNTIKYYEYRVKCNVNGYIYDELEGIEAKSKEEALNLIKERYKNWEDCIFEKVNFDKD